MFSWAADRSDRKLGPRIEHRVPALYDDNRIAYDLLRFHDAFVLRQSVRELIAPSVLFPRNYVTNNDECIVRMTQLHVNPWLGMYVSPVNAIVLDEHFPLLPAEVSDGWKELIFDNIVLDYSYRRTKILADSSSARNNGSGDQQRSNVPAAYEIAPIDSSTVVVPSSNLAVLNFGDSPDVIDLASSSGPGARTAPDNFCARDIKLSVVLNTDEDFGLADLDAYRGEAANGNGADNKPASGGFGDNPFGSSFSGVADAKPPGRTLNADRPDERDDFLSFLRTY